jgi:hypothetical protein
MSRSNHQNCDGLRFRAALSGRPPYLNDPTHGPTAVARRTCPQQSPHKGAGDDYGAFTHYAGPDRTGRQARHWRDAALGRSMADGWSEADIMVNYPGVGRTLARKWACKVTVACFGAPRSMKIGTTTSLSHFDAALYSMEGIAKRPPDLPEPYDDGVGPEYGTSHAAHPEREALNTPLCIAHICAIADWVCPSLSIAVVAKAVMDASITVTGSRP